MTKLLLLAALALPMLAQDFPAFDRLQKIDWPPNGMIIWCSDCQPSVEIGHPIEGGCSAPKCGACVIAASGKWVQAERRGCDRFLRLTGQGKAEFVPLPKTESKTPKCEPGFEPLLLSCVPTKQLIDALIGKLAEAAKVIREHERRIAELEKKH